MDSYFLCEVGTEFVCNVRWASCIDGFGVVSRQPLP